MLGIFLFIREIFDLFLEFTVHLELQLWVLLAAHGALDVLSNHGADTLDAEDMLAWECEWLNNLHHANGTLHGKFTTTND